MKEVNIEDLSIVTEIGVFGELDISDPTVQNVKKKKKQGENVDDTIAEAITENAQTLSDL